MCLKSLRRRNSFRSNMFYTLVIIKLKKQGFDYFLTSGNWMLRLCYLDASISKFGS